MSFDIDTLRERYKVEDPLEPCRICGAELTIGFMGEGRIEYACPDAGLLKHKMGTSEWREAMDHYAGSKVTRIPRGDQEVLDLLDAYEQLDKS